MIRILIAAGIRLYREGLAYLLAQHEGIEVIGASSDRAETLTHLDACAADVVVLDMATPDSYEMAREIRAVAPTVPLVAVGVADSDKEVIACVEAGAAGYVTRDGSVDVLVAAVLSAARGELVCSPRMAGQIVRRLATLAADHEPATISARLTPREWEIALLLEQSLSNKEIAERLRIEVATVKNHVHNLLEKLKIHRRAEAAGLLRRGAAIAAEPSGTARDNPMRG